MNFSRVLKEFMYFCLREFSVYYHYDDYVGSCPVS